MSFHSCTIAAGIAYQTCILRISDMPLLLLTLYQYYYTTYVCMYCTYASLLHYSLFRYRISVEQTFELFDDWSIRLSRPIKDLDDIREAMKALKELREKEIEIDMNLGPIEESYSILQRMNITVPQEEVDRVDTLRYTWEKLQIQAHDVTVHLVEIQNVYHEKLKVNIEVFAKDVTTFTEDYKLVSATSQDPGKL